MIARENNRMEINNSISKDAESVLFVQFHSCLFVIVNNEKKRMKSHEIYAFRKHLISCGNHHSPNVCVTQPKSYELPYFG